MTLSAKTWEHSDDDRKPAEHLNDVWIFGFVVEIYRNRHRRFEAVQTVCEYA